MSSTNNFGKRKRDDFENEDITDCKRKSSIVPPNPKLDNYTCMIHSNDSSVCSIYNCNGIKNIIGMLHNKATNNYFA